MTDSINDTLDLMISRIIQAPRSAIWKAWTEPHHFKKWWAPAPIKTTVFEMDLRPGGAFNTMMRMEDGREFPGNGCFLDVVENERIVFTDVLEGGWRPSKTPFFTAIITMEDHSEGTKYTARALHKDETDRKKHAEMGFVEGWGTCIGQLAKIAEHISKS